MVYAFISFLLCFVHPLHISVTEIEYDDKENELEIVIRIFADDLETAIRADRNTPSLDLLNPVGISTDNLVEGYVMNRVKVSLDGSVQKIKYLGSEMENEAMLCYVQVSGVKKNWRTIAVTNQILLETFDDQSNLVHVTVGDNVKSLRLMKDNSTQSVSFDRK